MALILSVTRKCALLHSRKLLSVDFFFAKYTFKKQTYQIFDEHKEATEDIKA